MMKKYIIIVLVIALLLVMAGCGVPGSRLDGTVLLPVHGTMATGSGRNSFYSLAITEDGRLWTWGNNVSGQLGNRMTTDHHSPARTIMMGDVIKDDATWEKTP